MRAALFLALACLFACAPQRTGRVEGRARLTGPVPEPKRISMEAEEDCEKLQSGPVYDRKVVTGAEGALGNVFVYVKQGLEGRKFEAPKEAVVLEQKGCQFVPRVLALRTGQTLAVRNSDPVSHNVHPMPSNNRDWNQQQPPGAEDLRRKFARPEVMIPVKCNVHNWMRSWIAVLDHPFFAVTGIEGRFAWDGLPEGEYTLAAWHEAYGEQVKRVKVSADTPLVVEFGFP